MAKPTTIRLSEPLQIDGRAVTELRVRRPKVRDLKALETHKDGASDMDQGIAMVALLTDLPAAAIEDMDAGDFATLSEVIAGFLPKPPAPKAGERSSPT